MVTVGQSVPRLEDVRLLQGAGRFLDDVDLAGQLSMRVVRSQVAHARIVSIDTSEAERLPGVFAVVTAEDVGDLAIAMRVSWTLEELDLRAFHQPILARGRVRYVGEPIAAVLADDAYLAEDAAELVRVEYEELPVVLDSVEAVRDGSPSLRDDVGNEITCITKSYGDIDSAFAGAAHVVRGEFKVGRASGVPLETRGFVAEYDRGRDRFTMWGALGAHVHQEALAGLLGVARTQIHMRSSDVGGDFGTRGGVYPEHVLVPFLARLTGRPVKWLEDRSENLVATAHAREQVHRIEAAFDEDGMLLGLRDEIWHSKGAYIRGTGVLVSELTVGMLCGPYRIPAFCGTIHAVATNKTPLSPCRAPGRYEGAFARERLLDVAANQLGIDPVELRRMNLLRPDELPHEPGMRIVDQDFVLDSGDFPGLLAKTIEAAGFDQWREEAEQLREQGRLVGTGLAYLMDKGGLGVYETGAVNIDVTGKVRVLIGGYSVGQGIETVMAQIAADELGISPGSIEVLHGDTELVPEGVGSWGSRSTVTGGGAVLAAAKKTADKARRVAAELLEVDPSDLVLEDGRVSVTGSASRGLTLAQVAAACTSLPSAERDEEPGLGARDTYVSRHMNYPYGATLVQVEVDPATGGVEVRRMLVSCEVGHAINPMLTDGQIVGGAAQGIGGALYEEFAYDESGQPRSTSFMDYLIPTASDMPRIETLICEDAPTPDNTLRAKGVGEAGCIGTAAAIANAIEDALGAAGSGTISSIPIMPALVRELAGAASPAP